MINFNDSNISITVLLLLANLLPLLNQGITGNTNESSIGSCGTPAQTGNNGPAGTAGIPPEVIGSFEKIITTLINEERQKQKNLYELLKKMNSDTDETI
ncbi:hypothetical protein J9317_08630 [Metabacillus sp. KIGAM252]|uniref:Collagen-like protein n=1 Tax=Metabacillus flavus TaxID=2823519 RepID=A0ABS5LDJ8_9BACI|nr:hypothetical protein [Metabacillus flavus]MBS2968821.1 hypothetical protein [Metabacillus flavus]